MGKPGAVISCLLLIVGAVTAQEAHRQASERLPQWLTGIIAVVGFLFLTFVSFLVKKAWCDGPSRSVKGMTSLESERQNEFVITNSSTYEVTLDVVRSKEEINAYDNLVFDRTDNKVTAM